MAESFKSKRIRFNKSGDQRKFILNAKSRLDLSCEQFSQKLGICSRTLKDWEKEKFNMTLGAMSFICKILNTKFPKGVEVMDKYWYVTKGAKKGGRKVYEKYGIVGGDPDYRIKKWREWWKKEGKFKKYKIFQCYPFKKPVKSENLAEFVGVLLGDGGITKNQIKVTLHCADDLEYSKFIEALIFKLFSLKPSNKKKKNCMAFDIIISRTGLVRFCVEKLGLKTGNKIKQQIDIPEWIKQNKKYRIACLRGLVDTDGCIIIHRYESRGKWYSYKKIGFTSRSVPLLRSVRNILDELKIKNRIMGKYDVRIEARRDVSEYFKLVGTNNPKHLKRYAI